MEKLKKNRVSSAKPSNHQKMKKFSLNNSVDLKFNKFPFNNNHVEKLNVFRSNEKFLDDFWKRDKNLKIHKNNKEKIKLKENNRYKKFFNKVASSEKNNMSNINIQSNMLAKAINKSLQFNNQQKKALIFNNNIIKNQNVPTKIIIKNKINVNQSLDNQLFLNKFININNKNHNNNNNKQINNNINNNNNNKFIINVKLKPNPQQEKKPNKNRSASAPKIRASNIILMSKTNANGLANIGATCYMNATLQCLAHIQRLTHYLLNSETKKKISSDKIKYKLTSAYLTVLENLWQNKNIKYYSPNQFKDVISEMNSLFAGIQANDSKDLILFLLETMHNELNLENKNINNINNQENYVDDIQAQYNYEMALKNFSNYFKEKYNSIISSLFYGMFNSIMCCQNCNVVLNNVQCYNILIFPLQKVKEYKMKMDNIVDLYECFDYNQRPDLISGKSFYCNNCRTMVDNVNTTKILYCPKILVINFNRGKGLEFDVKINFPEYIDIINYVYYKDNSPSFYELVGIVTHFGPSSMGGHFIAFCKSFGNQQWYKYNDAIVDPSSFEEAKNTGVPYILFYSYIKR